VAFQRKHLCCSVYGTVKYMRLRKRCRCTAYSTLQYACKKKHYKTSHPLSALNGKEGSLHGTVSPVLLLYTVLYSGVPVPCGRAAAPGSWPPPDPTPPASRPPTRSAPTRRPREARLHLVPLAHHQVYQQIQYTTLVIHITWDAELLSQGAQYPSHITASRARLRHASTAAHRRNPSGTPTQ